MDTLSRAESEIQNAKDIVQALFDNLDELRVALQTAAFVVDENNGCVRRNDDGPWMPGLTVLSEKLTAIQRQLDAEDFIPQEMKDILQAEREEADKYSY